MIDFKVQIDKSGRILIPLKLRKELNAKTGDTIVLRKTDNEVKLLSFQSIIDEVHDKFAYNSGDSMTDKVLQERKGDKE